MKNNKMKIGAKISLYIDFNNLNPPQKQKKKQKKKLFVLN